MLHVWGEASILHLFIISLPQINTEQTNFRRGCLDVNVTTDNDYVTAQFGDYHVRSVSRLVTSDISDAYVDFDVEDGDAVDDGPLHRWALQQHQRLQLSQEQHLQGKPQPPQMLPNLGLRAIPPFSRLPPGALMIVLSFLTNLSN